MFGQFIYYIIALLIYSAYPGTDAPFFSLAESVSLFFLLTGLFIFLNRIQFRRLKRKIHTDAFYRVDHQFNRLLTRQFITAILLFLADIYLLELPHYLPKKGIFLYFPTLHAIVFIALFVCYLSVAWYYAYELYCKLNAADISRSSYIFSNISFSVPVLLPWLALSVIDDIINVLPFEQPKRFLSTPMGEYLYFFVVLLSVVILGPLLIQKFWRCKPLENGYMRTRIEELCRYAGLQFADVLYWPIFGGRMITAGVMGLVRKFRYLLVTDALLTCLHPAEVDAVIAHEIGHVKKKHLLYYIFFIIGNLFLSYITFSFLFYFVIDFFAVNNLSLIEKLFENSFASSAFSILFMAIFFVYFRYVFGYFMRNFERQADTYVFQLFNSAEHLISTFEKIVLTSGQPPDKPNWHHFSIAERVSYLKKCEADKSWISRHDSKVKKSMAIYVSVLFLFGGFGYSWHYGSLGKKRYEKLIVTNIEKNPSNPDLYALLGEFYYSEEEYEKTIEAYEKSISLNPDNAKALNNLAWLYATCPEDQYRNPERALSLAQRAVELDEKPHVWDTLAESYYVNGQYDKAINAGERAFNLAQTDLSYYENQLEKFYQKGKRYAN